MPQVDYDSLINGVEGVQAAQIAYAVASEEWTKVTNGYLWSNDYDDEQFSEIKNDKSIVIDKNQVNLTQEKYSQYIPFKMPRRYDNLDLAVNTVIRIHYIRKKKEGDTITEEHGNVTPINVKYNENELRFGWLVDEAVTSYVGDIDFEIIITGMNDLGNAFTWKTKPSKGELKVLAGLQEGTPVEISDDWMTSLVNAFKEVVEDYMTTETYYDKDQVDSLLSNYATNIDLANASTQLSIKDPVSIGVNFDENTYEFSVSLTTGEGILTTNTINLPIESLVMSAVYDETEKDLVITLQNGQATRIPLDDIIGASLNSYYTKTWIDEKIGNVGETDIATYVTNSISTAVTDAITTLQGAVETAVGELEDSIAAVEAKIGELGESETVVDYVDAAIDSIDISDKLGELKIGESTYDTVVEYVNAAVDSVDVTETVYTKEEINEKLGELGTHMEGPDGEQVPVANSVVDFVNDAIGKVDVTDQLKDYAKASEVEARIGELGEYTPEGAEEPVTYTVKEYVDKAVSEKNLDDYYNKNETETKINATINARLGDIIDDDGNDITVSEYVETKINEGGKQNYYKATYGDTEVGGEIKKNIFTLWTANSDFDPIQPGDIPVSVASQFVITGGSGGPSVNTNTLIVYYDRTASGANLNNYAFREKQVADKQAIIKYSFVGTEPNGATIASADAKWEYKEASTGKWQTIKTEQITPTTGEEKLEFNISNYLTDITTYNFRLTVTDASGAIGYGNWTVKHISYKVETVKDGVEQFNDKKAYKIGDLTFYYVPYGAGLRKTVHFIWDNKEVGTVETERSGSLHEFILPISHIPQQARHGSHLLQVYMTAMINGEMVQSDSLYKDIILFDEARTVPVIGCAPQTYEVKQYSTLNIEYAVFDPTTSYPRITIDTDGVIEERTLEQNVNSLSFKSDVIGSHTITISCTNDKTNIITSKTININVVGLGYDITPVSGAVIDFDPVGKSNADKIALSNDTWKVWDNGTYSLIAAEGFDWINGGYQTEKDKSGKIIPGSEHFKIKDGDKVYFDYKFFGGDRQLGTASNPKENGKDFKIVFKTDRVQKSDASFLSCVSPNGGNPIGMEMFVNEGYVHCGGGSLKLPYSENDIIEYGFQITRSDSNTHMIMGYEDGVTTSAFVYNDGHSLLQAEDERKYIEIAPKGCDVYVYKLKIYERELSDEQVLQNFIADARTGEEMVARFERNQIYNESEELDPATLSQKCPWLRVITISTPQFTQSKKDPRGETTIEYRYEDGKKNGSISYWKCVDGVHIGQGTSSDKYGAAGRNIDLVLKTHKDVGNSPIIYLDPEETQTTKKVALSPTSIPNNYFNIKVNIASSENANNALLQKRYNEYNPYKRPFVDKQKIDGVDKDGKPIKISPKDTMEFFNCVVFLQETSDGEHSEFNDKKVHFYAIGNIGDSKKTDETRTTDPDDDYECCLEIGDVELPLSDFPVDTIANAMRYETKDDGTKEYLFATQKNLDARKLYIKNALTGEYEIATGTIDVENVVYYIDGKDSEDFSGDFTYEWRYIKEYKAKDFKTEENTDEEAEALADARNEEIFNYCNDQWWKFYDFVTKTTDKDFKDCFENYFVKDSAFYYYLFTTRYTMVDNRAKNSFWHYGKTGGVYAKDVEYTSENGEVIFSAKAGEPIRKWDLTWGYDMDTALGTDNDGDMVYRYGYEDTDVDNDGVEIFRESDSTFFCRVRDLFANELATSYANWNNAWSATNLINQFDEWQSQFPEELWRTDIQRKYIRTITESFVNGGGDKKYLDNMANGKKKYQRRQFERNQEKYMASKYRTPAASSDANKILLRTADTSKDTLAVPANYDVTLKPYTYMYLTVDYGNGLVARTRVTDPSKTYDLKYPGNGRPDFMDIESAHWIESMGDLSPAYLTTVTTTPAEKLKELIIGSDDYRDFGDGNILTYYNKYLTTLTVDKANGLLEKINIENVKYDNALDVKVLENLQEVYAKGSSITGFVGADGGALTTIQLPDIGTLVLKNLNLLTELTFEGNEKLNTLDIENCNTIDWLPIINNAPNLRFFNMKGINWHLSDDSLLARIYEMLHPNDPNALAELSGRIELDSAKELDLEKYRARWKDLEIIIDDEDVIPQYLVKFVNDDGTEVDRAYVVRGETVAETTVIPTKEPSAQFTYRFVYWIDASGNEYSFGKPVTEPLILTAKYEEDVRQYTVKYWLNNKATSPLYESVGEYGSWVAYKGEWPTDTRSEIAGTYRLFSGWDKSGYINGDKNIYARFDEYVYNEQELASKKLEELSRIQVYAASKRYPNNAKYRFEQYIPLPFGNDFNYDDIVSKEKLHGNSGNLDGTRVIETSEKLFNGENDFTLAVDFKRTGTEQTGKVLFGCSDANGGFEVTCEGPQLILTWGKGGAAQSSIIENIDVGAGETPEREILVIRHKNLSTALDIFYSQKFKNEVLMQNLTTSIQTGEVKLEASLLFGGRSTGSSYTAQAKGEIYWSKLWEGALSNEECHELALWPHEVVNMESVGLYDATGPSQDAVPYTHQKEDGGSEYSQFTLIAQTVLDKIFYLKQNHYDNTAGWPGMDVDGYLNNRYYQGINKLWKVLIKNTNVPYQKKDEGGSVSIRDTMYRYIFVPSLKELKENIDSRIDDSYGTFDVFVYDEDRRCGSLKNPVASFSYWTRSIDPEFYQNFAVITSSGENSWSWPPDRHHVRIMFTI